MSARKIDADMERAMGPADRPPPFDYHNCAGCDSGRKPCRFGHANPRNCDWLHARDD